MISDQRRPQRLKADAFNGSNLMVGSQPVSSTATGLGNERICCYRPLRTCKNSKISECHGHHLCGSQCRTRFHFCVSAYGVPFKPVTPSEATEDPFHYTAQIAVPAPAQACTWSGCENSAILFIQLHPYRALVIRGLTAGVGQPHSRQPSHRRSYTAAGQRYFKVFRSASNPWKLISRNRRYSDTDNATDRFQRR